MNRFQDHLLGCANRGYRAFNSGKPCEPPYKFTPRAKGLYRQRCEHWIGGWREAESKAVVATRKLHDEWNAP